MTWLCLDVETTVKTHAKRKASPFHPDNWVVMMGWCTKDNPTPQCQRYTQDSQHIMSQQFVKLLSTPGLKFVVGANIKFDLLHLLRSPEAYAAWQKYVAAGGLVWDVQLGEYVLHGQDQGSHMLSLDELCLRYGCDTKVDEVKLLWEAGVQTEDIDPDLLRVYLIGEDLPNGGRREGDIGNTRDVFIRQAEAIRKAGMSRLIMLEMGALIASTEMERNGMYVDKELGLKLADELRAELAEARNELDSYLPAALPFEFNWGSRHHLSPIIFGGVINYDAKEYDMADGTKCYHQPPPPGQGVYANKKGYKYVFG